MVYSSQRLFQCWAVKSLERGFLFMCTLIGLENKYPVAGREQTVSGAESQCPRRVSFHSSWGSNLGQSPSLGDPNTQP